MTNDRRPPYAQRPVLVAKCLMAMHIVFLVAILVLFAQARHGVQVSATFIALLVIISMVVQFSWSLSVGLYVGPGTRRRPLLWASLLTIFVPMVIVRISTIIAWFIFNPLVALGVLFASVIVLACETWAGVLQGLKLHSILRD